MKIKTKYTWWWRERQEKSGSPMSFLGCIPALDCSPQHFLFTGEKEIPTWFNHCSKCFVTCNQMSFLTDIHQQDKHLQKALLDYCRKPLRYVLIISFNIFISLNERKYGNDHILLHRINIVYWLDSETLYLGNI